MSAAPPELAALHERASILADLERVHALLFWDQNVMMPPRGAAARGDHSATLESVTHERLTDPELGRLLERLEPWAAEQDPDDDDASLVRELRRDFEKAVRVPTSLAAEASRAAALGQAAWQEARAAADFGRFRDALELQIELRHRYVGLLRGLRASLRRPARRLRAGDDDRAAAAAAGRAGRRARPARGRGRLRRAAARRPSRSAGPTPSRTSASR